MDDATKVLPDKVRRLEARVAQVEDGLGMLQRADKRTAVGLTVRDTQLVAAMLTASALWSVFLVLRLRKAAAGV